MSWKGYCKPHYVLEESGTEKSMQLNSAVEKNLCYVSTHAELQTRAFWGSGEIIDLFYFLH